MNRWMIVLSLALAAASCGKKQTQTEDTVPVETPEQKVVEIPVEFESGGLMISGTVTRPSGDGPFPAIAVAAGSGPTDRDWLSPMLPGTNGSAKLLAQALAERGVVLLRYDKRGTGKTGMPTEPVKWGDYAAELSAATKTLASQPYVDPAKIYVAGHSEGGAHALRVAIAPPVPLAGLLLLSTAGRTLQEIVLWQISSQIRASGLNPVAADAEIAALDQALQTIASGGTVDPQKVGQLPGVQQFILALQNPLSVDFARGLLTYDPQAAFAQFDLPVLVLNGNRDIQVDPVLDAQPLAEAAKKAGRPTTLAIVEDADHVLKSESLPKDQLGPAQGMSYNADGRELSTGVVDAIVAFVKP